MRADQIMPGGGTMSDYDQEWHEWRSRGIGGSDIPKILGLSRYGSAYTVWAERVGLLPLSPETQRQRIGKRMEPVMQAEFHDFTDLYVHGTQTWCQHPERPWMRCTVDGFVLEHGVDDIGEALGVYEAKTDGRFAWPDGVPESIAAQCQWQLAVTGLDHAWVAVMHAGFQFRVYELERDDKAIAHMIDVAGELWEHCVDGTPPPIDASDATHDALARLFPDTLPGKRAEVPRHLFDDWTAARDARLEYEREAKACKALQQAAENQIAALAEDAELIECDGELVLTYRTVERNGYTVAPTSYRTLKPPTRRDTK